MPESTRQRLAFNTYWTMGAQRSIERLHAEVARDGKAPSLRTFFEWSRRYHWQARLADLERQAREADDVARIAAVREMQERQARAALLLQQKGVEWLAQLPPGEASAEAAIRALVEGAKLERLVRGEPTERTEQTQSGDPRLEALTDAELDHLIDGIT
jgi:hypothetical protein